MAGWRRGLMSQVSLAETRSMLPALSKTYRQISHLRLSFPLSHTSLLFPSRKIAQPTVEVLREPSYTLQPQTVKFYNNDWMPHTPNSEMVVITHLPANHHHRLYRSEHLSPPRSTHGRRRTRTNTLLASSYTILCTAASYMLYVSRVSYANETSSLEITNAIALLCPRRPWELGTKGCLKSDKEVDLFGRSDDSVGEIVIYVLVFVVVSSMGQY